MLAYSYVIAHSSQKSDILIKNRMSLSLVSVIGQRLVMDLRMIDRASLALSRDERGGQMPGEEYVPPNSPIMFDLNMIPMISNDTALDEEVGTSHTVPDEK